eukprot:TRINITY_DN115803_c0_g1_i1.p2 TRINITY_DN115803_c0_g1~~TRINITY_DN115803_c0_g1_i1.p2  ORF type:complete len:210 (-),score=67.05 TRINITY_DN115803_c0_g1_i1:525-1154(-)
MVVEHLYDYNGFWRCGGGGGEARWQRWRRHSEACRGACERRQYWRWRGFGIDSQHGGWQARSTRGGQEWRRQGEAEALRKEVDDLKTKTMEKQETECYLRWLVECRLLNLEKMLNFGGQAQKSKSNEEKVKYAKEGGGNIWIALQGFGGDLLATVKKTVEANCVMMEKLMTIVEQKGKSKGDEEQAMDAKDTAARSTPRYKSPAMSRSR